MKEDRNRITLDYDHVPRRKSRTAAGIVLLIAVMLLAVLVPKFLAVVPTSARSGAARVMATRTGLTNLATSLDAFQADTGSYPGAAAGLSALVSNSSGAPNWHGPYIISTPVDAWGSPYKYRTPGIHNPQGYDLWSNGPDRKPNTTDDIKNW